MTVAIPMFEAWYQVWMNLPVVGRQWAGWFYGNQIAAQALAESLRASAAVSLGATWDVADQNGTPLPKVAPGAPPGVPGLPSLGDLLKGWGT